MQPPIKEQDISEPLSHNERLNVAFDTTGHPFMITYIVAYASVEDLPTTAALSTRARSLIDSFPLLKARVIDHRTSKPKWGVLSDAQVDTGIKTLVTDREMPVDDSDFDGNRESDESISGSFQAIFASELGNKNLIRIGTGGLLWRIVRYHSKPNESARAESGMSRPAYIAVTLNHVISDGMSTQNLAHELLAGMTPQPPSGSRGDSVRPVPRLPLSLTATFDCRPSLQFIFHQVWHEIIVPALPRCIGDIFRMQPCWPGSPSEELLQVGDDRQTFDHVSLTLTQMQRLKDIAKRNGIATLHPILQIAAVVALWIVVGDEATPSSHSGCDAATALEVVHSVPISFRQSSLGHPMLTGNYVSLLDACMSCPEDGELLFWREAKEYASRLHSQAGQKRALEVIGSLKFIPDRQRDVDEQSLTPTGWESFFLERSKRAPLESVAVSNLGYAQRPLGSIGMAWCQSATALHPPVYFNIVGHEGGLDMTLSCWMVDRFARQDLAVRYKEVLEALAGFGDEKGPEAVTGDPTFADIRDRIRHGGN